MRKVCSVAGCEEVSLPDAPHCEMHSQRAAERLAERRAAAQLGAQAKASRRLYGLARWRRESAAFLKLQSNVLCVDCLDLGAVVPATDVDHIKPHKGDPKLFFDRTNWQALCHACHSRKTAGEVFHGKAPGVGK